MKRNIPIYSNLFSELFLKSITIMEVIFDYAEKLVGSSISPLFQKYRQEIILRVNSENEDTFNTLMTFETIKNILDDIRKLMDNETILKSQVQNLLYVARTVKDIKALNEYEKFYECLKRELKNIYDNILLRFCLLL